MTTGQHTSNSVQSIRELATRYAKAWNEHDIEAIMSMHAPQSAFHLHVHPYPEASTHEEIRAQFEGFFRAMPDMTFETVRLQVCEGLFVHEWFVTCTLAEPFPISDSAGQPDGRAIRFKGVDIIPCEDGLVKRKDCYFDGVGLELQLTFPD